MDKSTLLLVGSEAVVESGGLINATGSNQIAIIAKHANKHFMPSRKVRISSDPLDLVFL